MSTHFADLEHKATEEQLAEAREALRQAEARVTAIERAIATSLVEEPEVITVPGDLDPRVKRGVAWLDENVEGWAEKINLELFNIRQASSCVLGQIYADYSIGCSTHDLRDPAPIDAQPDGWLHHGYELRDHYGFQTWGTTEGVDQDWAVLQDSWVRAIKFRQEHP